MKRYGKGAVSLFVAAWLIVAGCITAVAADAPVLAGVTLREDGAGLFLHGDVSPDITSKISGWDCEITFSGTLEEVQAQTRTLLLIDTSTSVREISRQQVKDLLTMLAENKQDGEQYAVATFGEEYRLLAGFESDRYDLVKAVESLTWSEQASGIYEAVQTAVQFLRDSNSEEIIFTQIVVFSDGVEASEAGITQQELFFELAASPLPVHTVGFLYSGNAEELKNLYAISRLSGGFSAEFNAQSNFLTFTNSLSSYLAGITCLEINFPPEAMDGAVRPLTLADSAGATLLQHDLHMPGTVQVADDAAPEPEPTEEEPEPEEEHVPEDAAETGPGVGMITVIAIAAAAVIVVIIGLGVRASKRKKQETGEVAVNLPPAGTESWVEDDRTQLLIPEQQSARGHEILLVLNDLAQPHRRFEIAVEDTVEIGREPRTPGITIDYDNKISKRHCSVTKRDNALWVEDLGSTNKTFVNGEMVTAPRRLKENDILSCGKTRCSIRIEQR